MYQFYADDRRILTPPKELEPRLKSAFPSFSRLLGHIRFFYMADEIWDGKSSLIFNADGEQLIAITLDEGVFYVHIADEDFRITGEALLDNIFEILNKMPIGWHRPFEQLTANPDPNVFSCGYRCDLCLGYKCYNEIDFPGSDNFAYMNWVCYHGCLPGIDIERPPTSEKGKGVFRCSGCTKNRNKYCRSYPCSKEKGYANCAECGDYHSCDIYSGSHHAGQCNLGISAEEVTKLVIPYCMKERLDVLRNSLYKYDKRVNKDKIT
jgi:hypothetical protein